MNNHYHNLVGVVLCGGKATRMDGKDKGLIPFNGQPMATYAVTAFSPCQQIIINANRHQDTYHRIFQLPVVSDHNNDFDGPLAGMLAGLHYAKENGFEWLITAPCDAPFIDNDYVHKMMSATTNTQRPIIMASDDFRQPVFAVLHAQLIDELDSFLQRPQKKILHFYEQVGYDTMYFSNSQLFTNINRPEDIKDNSKLQ